MWQALVSLLLLVISFILTEHPSWGQQIEAVTPSAFLYSSYPREKRNRASYAWVLLTCTGQTWVMWSRPRTNHCGQSVGRIRWLDGPRSSGASLLEQEVERSLQKQYELRVLGNRSTLSKIWVLLPQDGNSIRKIPGGINKHSLNCHQKRTTSWN